MEDFDEIEDLIQEAPGGENHGRTRGQDGGLLWLDKAAHEYAESGFEYFVEIEIHGIRSTYVAGCRCPSCRRANSEYQRARRKRVTGKG